MNIAINKSFLSVRLLSNFNKKKVKKRKVSLSNVFYLSLSEASSDFHKEMGYK